MNFKVRRIFSDHLFMCRKCHIYPHNKKYRKIRMVFEIRGRHLGRPAWPDFLEPENRASPTGLRAARPECPPLLEIGWRRNQLIFCLRLPTIMSHDHQNINFGSCTEVTLGRDFSTSRDFYLQDIYPRALGTF